MCQQMKNKKEKVTWKHWLFLLILIIVIVIVIKVAPNVASNLAPLTMYNEEDFLTCYKLVRQYTCNIIYDVDFDYNITLKTESQNELMRYIPITINTNQSELMKYIPITIDNNLHLADCEFDDSDWIATECIDKDGNVTIEQRK